MLRTVNLAAFYDRTQVLHDVNLRVEEGEIIGLVGANGAGKSSTLFSLMGLKTRTEGELWLDGEQIEHLPAYEGAASPCADSRTSAPVPADERSGKS
jgi:ABC-type branched-subunit amino acid transport system ATPase component